MTVTRDSAQARVLRSAQRMSAELLVAENLAQAETARIFARDVPAVRPRTVSAFRDSRPTRAKLELQHRRALDEASDVVTRLVRKAGVIAAAAIEVELRAIERALPAVHRGRTVRTMVAVDPSVVVTRALDLHLVHAEGLQERWVAVVARAGVSMKTPDAIHDLLVGRARPQGAWWATSGSMQSHIRWVSVATANAVRHTAMREFNA